MLKYFACGIAVVLLGTILGCATEQSQSRPQSASDKNSGFLRDYTKLHEARDPEGLMVRQWVSPKFTRDNYNAILLDPLVFYPEPRPTDKVSAETLQQMLSYSDNVLKRSLSKRFKLVDRVGPRVARLRIGITGVAAENQGLVAYQYLPIALVDATKARTDLPDAPQAAFVVIESEVTDSVTGELLAEQARVGSGQRLKKIGGKDEITLDTVRPLLDELAAGALPDLERFVKAR